MDQETKFRAVGNSTGVTFKKSLLDEAGFSGDEAVVMRAEEGRIVLERSDPLHTKAMEALDICLNRYDNTLRELAK